MAWREGVGLAGKGWGLKSRYTPMLSWNWANKSEVKSFLFVFVVVLLLLLLCLSQGSDCILSGKVEKITELNYCIG